MMELGEARVPEVQRERVRHLGGEAESAAVVLRGGLVMAPLVLYVAEQGEHVGRLDVQQEQSLEEGFCVTVTVLFHVGQNGAPPEHRVQKNIRPTYENSLLLSIYSIGSGGNVCTCILTALVSPNQCWKGFIRS